MTSSSVPRKLVWIFIVWFKLAAHVSANEKVALHTKDWVSAQCGDNVTLMCNATSSQQQDIRQFFWMFGNKTCQNNPNQTEQELQCERINSTFNHMVTLTLKHVMPIDQGKYLCKLRSTSGSWNNGSQLRVGDCLEKSKTSVNDTYAKCSFEGVYPSGVVHWFQGGTNFTNGTNTHEQEDKHKRFNVWSTIMLKKEAVSQSYTCSLWVPALGRYVSTQEVASSGSLTKLQMICMTVTMMVSLMM